MTTEHLGASRRLGSGIARSEPDRITVRDLDLATELMGIANLGDMAFLELLGRMPSGDESIVFNAMLVALVEHGVTPNTLAARLTYLGAPESLQGAVAAGIVGLGSVFVGTIEGAARMLQEAMAEASDGDLESLADRIVAGHRTRGELVPGLGHPLHKPADPRTARLFELAQAHDLSGQYVELMNRIRREAERQSGRVLPINVTGAVGALAGELGMPWQIARGLGLIARTVGIVAHISEEMTQPMAGEVWRYAEGLTVDDAR
jgi:citrate synthase